MTIKPARARILKSNFVWILVLLIFIAVPILHWLYPTGWQPIGWKGVLIYLILLLATCYTIFVFVIQAIYAELQLDNRKVIFRTIARTNAIDLSEIIDIDFSLSSNRKFSGRNTPQDSLFLLSPNSASVDSWRITTGWNNKDVLTFVENVRSDLATRGIKSFPLFESGNYDSSIKRSS